MRPSDIRLGRESVYMDVIVTENRKKISIIRLQN